MCVKRPVFTWVLMLVILVFGAVSYASLGLDKYPKVDLPMVVITTTLQGAAPEEVESEISDKIEAAVNTISGIDELRSTSSEGVSTVTVSFALEKNADVGAQEVRDHIDNALPTLPKGIDPPVVSRVDPDAAPVLYVTLRGPGEIRELTELADKQVRRRIESISGVGQVTVIGGVKRVIKILVDPIALRSFDLTGADVRQAITNQNFAVPGGTIERGPRQLTLRIEGKVGNLEELRKLVVKNDVGHSIRLEDVATVEDGAEDEASWASEDGDRVVTLSIRKQSGVNTVAMVDEVKSRLAEIQSSLPTGAKLVVVRDNSSTIRTSVDAVLEHLVLGAVLAAVVVLAFLGSARSTIIAALAIPISVVGSFVLMYLLDFTLNMMTLLALALAVGIVIDDAIVVLENIHRFITHKKLAPMDAAVAATNDIGLAVVATTLSLLAVFLPVAFMSGIVGRFLRSFGLTMASAIAVSLVVSFTLTPMLCARWLEGVDADAQREGKKPLLERVVDVVYMPIERAYMTVLRWVMARRWVIVVASAATLGSCAPLAKAVPISFTPEDDTAQFSVEVRTPEGTSLQATRLVADGVAREIRGLAGVEKTLLTIGDNAQSTPNLANVYVKLTEPVARAESQEVIMARVRREVLAHQPKEILTSVAQISDFGGTSAAVSYTLAGPDLDKLADVAERVTEKLERVPGAVDVRSSLILGKPEVRLAIDRARAADLGVTPADVATTLQLLVGGLKVSTYSERGEDYDIRVRARPEYRVDERGLLMTVPSRTAKSVPLDSVVRTAMGNGPSKIERLNRRRQIGISCNVAPGVGQSTILQALERIVAEERLPSGYQALAAGSSRETGKAGRAFLLAFAASFVFMYLVLAAQFESWIHPVTILVCLPLTVPFALLSLLLLRQQLTIMSALGLLVLFGVVKKNSILQVDHTNHLRGEGMPREEAILEANRDRLRPILMTTVAFVAGMLPLLFSHGVGSGINHNIAGVIVGGQALSLVLTLLATPVFYSLFDDVEVWWRRFRGHAPRAVVPVEVPAEVHLRESA
ncbi:RND multidrug efflux transporter [Labilithrix luteola]|uniref:RND multidrug efflux transporter n=1 Tax=Labilithrix luteola TaxID=1391654 RepID=A0A0K1Q3X6_9BACT|nr:RND multidrug efflux transporter [Labilithrix luteola]